MRTIAATRKPVFFKGGEWIFMKSEKEAISAFKIVKADEKSVMVENYSRKRAVNPSPFGLGPELVYGEWELEGSTMFSEATFEKTFRDVILEIKEPARKTVRKNPAMDMKEPEVSEEAKK